MVIIKDDYTGITGFEARADFVCGNLKLPVIFIPPESKHIRSGFVIVAVILLDGLNNPATYQVSSFKYCVYHFTCLVDVGE